MAQDPSQFVISPDMWALFTDRDTSTFLYGGYILFFKDSARTVGKPVYQLTGTGIPPASPYSYIEQGFLNGNGAWQLDLNSQGAIDLALYLNPYDSNGNVELYYIEVYSGGDVFQFSLEGWPQSVTSQAQTGTTVTVNYFPNPQFLLHNNVEAFAGGLPGQIPSGTDTLNIAQGGWYFERSAGSSATDFILFNRFGSFSDTPPANPRYEVNFICTSADGSDTVKDIVLRFPNVNTFATTVSATKMTLSFWGITNSGSTTAVSFIEKLYFGAGGSAATDNILSSVSVANTRTQYTVTFTPQDNTGETIGTGDDDYIEFGIRIAPTASVNVSFTDFILTDGTIVTPVIPTTTSFVSTYTALAGAATTPDYNEMNLYLPVILGPNGFTYDASEIGKPSPSFLETPSITELNADGATYVTSASDPRSGIPYARLQAVYFNQSTGQSLFGTGSDFVTAYVDASLATPLINLSTNSAAGVATPADGASPTGFTFAKIHSGGSSINALGYYASGASFYLTTVYPSKSSTGALNIPSFIDGYEVRGSPQSGPSPTFDTIYQIRSYLITLIRLPVASEYLPFITSDLTPTNADYYIWFKVDGAGSDPAPGGTGLELDILSTYSTTDVAILIAQTISNFQLVTIQTVAGSSLTGGNYFTFDTTDENYYLYYIVDSVGTDPAVAGKIGISCSVASTDSALQIAQKTALSLNSYSFAVPDLRGLFLRGWNDSQPVDQDAAIRAGFNPLSYGDTPGTFQWDASLGIGVAYSSNPTSYEFNLATTGSGNPQTRPLNMSVNWVIKY